MELSEIITVIVVLLIVTLPITIFCIILDTPSPYKEIKVHYKFIKDDKCYIVGEIIDDEEIDIYQINKKDYDELLEGFNYNMSTKNINYWSRFNKVIYDFEKK